MDLPRRIKSPDGYWLTLGGVCLILFAVGCSGREWQPGTPEFAASYGQLPRIQKTSNLKLRQEWNLIERANSRPVDLQSDAPPFMELVKQQAAAKAKAPTTPVERLAALFTRGKAARLAEETSAMFPKRFPPWPEELRRISDKRIQNEDARAEFARLCRAEPWDLGHQFTHGLMADTSYVDFLRAGAYLELLYAIEMLQRKRLDDALPSIESVLLAARRLGDVGHLASRLAAVELHERAIWTLQAVVAHPVRTREQLEACQRLVHAQLKHWPDEDRVWIGERADGMHTYELVRAGYVLSILEKPEIERIDRDIGVDEFQAAIRRNIDDDQLFYMQATDLLIEASRQPYAERLELFEALTAKMSRLRETEDHPRIADWILLPHIQMGHRALALDLARFRALSLGLSEALGENPGAAPNPLTGKPFRTEHDEKMIRIFDVDPATDDEPVIIPRLVVAARRSLDG